MHTRRSFVWLLLTLAILLLAPTVASAATLQPGFTESQVATISANRAWSLGTADFNSDGIDDLVCGNTAGDVYFYRGVGDGTFVRPSTYAVNAPYYDTLSIATGDFNGDGKADFIAPRTGGTSVVASDGVVYLFLGRGNGTFETIGALGSHQGYPLGDAGTDVQSVAAADVDGDGDLDAVASDVTVSENSRADITLFRNGSNDASGHPVWTAENVSSMPSQTANPDAPPYYPPKAYLSAYGLAFGDMDGDGDQDLLVTDIAAYLYLYTNDGRGHFSPVRYDTPTLETRPYAIARLHDDFTTKASIVVADFNADGRPDVAVGGSEKTWNGKVDVWLNEGLDSSRRPKFTSAGTAGGVGTQAQGLAVGQLNPSVDALPDLVEGNYEGTMTALFTSISDPDNDGIVTMYDLLPLIPSFPSIDLNGDGSLNRFDQIDLDGDRIGSVLDPLTGALLGDEDADGDGVANETDNLPYVANPEQLDRDGDGLGEVDAPFPQATLGDPLDNRDPDGDGVPNGPFNPNLVDAYKNAKRKMMTGTTPMIIRIDALGRWWQSEFTQTLADSIYMDPATFAVKYHQNWNGVYGSSTTSPPANLEGGKELAVSLVAIPKLLWTDPTVVGYLNDRLKYPGFELGQHGTYHAAIQPAGQPDSEMNGYDPLEMYAYLKVGQDTLLGNYDLAPDYLSGKASDPKVSWAGAANPLVSFAPPYDEFDRASVQAVAQLGYIDFSSDIWVEGLARTNMPAYTDQFDPYGVLHAPAHFMPEGETPSGSYADYADYIRRHITANKANVFLIEEVNFSGRDSADAVNDTIDPAKWANFQTFLQVVKDYPGCVPMTLGEYAMARSYDNAPGIANADQADTNHDGIGDVAETSLVAEDATATAGSPVTLRARLANQGAGLAGQPVAFVIDANGDGTYDTDAEPTATATTGSDGWAEYTLTLDAPARDISFRATFGGGSGYEGCDPEVGSLAVRLLSVVTAEQATGIAGREMTLRAQLTDEGGQPLAGKDVVLTIDLDEDDVVDPDEQSASAMTDVDGWASVPMTPTVQAGYLKLMATFAGDSTYLASGDSTSLRLQYGALLQAEPATATAGTSVTLRAKLADLDGLPIGGKMVGFDIDANGDGTYGATEPKGMAITDADGWAAYTYTPASAARVTTFRASFIGETDYAAAAPVSARFVVRHATSIVAQSGANRLTPPGASSPKGCFVATLKDDYGNTSVSGQTVVFLLDLNRNGTIEPTEIAATAVTNGNGVAWAALPKNAGQYGNYIARFDGTAVYLASSSTARVNGK